MGRKRDDRTEAPKSKFAGGKAGRRQQDPKSWKKLEANSIKKSKYIAYCHTFTSKIFNFFTLFNDFSLKINDL